MVNCNRCKYKKKCEIPSCVIATWEKCEAFEPKDSNADRIRSMTDEELAELFSKIDKGWDVICGSYISIKQGVLICGRDDFAKQILKWLQSEAE